MTKGFWIFLLTLSASCLFLAAAGHAAEPIDWQLGLQPAASPSMERITGFHNMLLYVITAICLLVFALLFIVIIRFNSKANPTPARFSHNTLIEVLWTVMPVVALIIIALPSMKMLYYLDRTQEPDMTLKVVGNQWYWSYEYPGYNDISFSSSMIPEDEIDASKGQKRLLSVDNPVILPTDTNIQIHVSANDVLHSFAMSAFGVKTDAVPGRLNETWVRITKPGTYYGQCSELCGKDHAYMPIEVIAVPKAEFEAWAEASKDGYITYESFKTAQAGAMPESSSDAPADASPEQ